MEKIMRWWVEFLVQLEAGKRVVAIFILITLSLTYALVNINGKLDKARIEAARNERLHGIEKERIKDSANIQIVRITTACNEEVKNMYKEQLEVFDVIEKGYKTIKRKNEKIIKANQ